MKITDVQCAGLRGATPKGGWARELESDDVVHTLIAVFTDAGDIGYGSAFTSDALVEASLEQLRPLIIGEDPCGPDRLSQIMHATTFWLGRGGAITHTISGIDIALWDLFGKSVDLPVSTLLGGRYREQVRPYASVLIEDPGPLAEKLTQLREIGFSAFKLGWGAFGRINDDHDDKIVAHARNTIGDDCLLAIDAGGSEAFWSNGLRWAIRTGDMLADHGVDWFEEALRPDDLDGYVALRQRSRVPISGGEVLSRRQEFHRFISAGAFDIVQPDTTKCGGISESRRIADMAETHNVTFIPHGWNTAMGLCADLHLVASRPATTLIEYVTGSAYIDELTDGNFALNADGTINVPTGPGLGVNLDPDALDRYATDARRLTAN